MRVEALDLLRSLAIFLVYLFHYMKLTGGAWLQPVAEFGWAGVDLFFVLSGYLIVSQLLGPVAAGGRPSLREFFIRRTLRIWPSYAAVLLLYFLLPGFRENSLPPLWRFLTFTQNFGLDFHARGGFSHAWSLCVEEQFYLIVPFAVLFLSRRGSSRKTVSFFAALVALGFVARALAWRAVQAGTGGPEAAHVASLMWIYYPTYNRLDGLLFGAAIAAVRRLRPGWWDVVSRQDRWILAASAASLAAAVVICRERFSFAGSVFGFALVSAGFALLVLAALCPASALARVKIPGARQGAALSYSLYLTHKGVIHLVHPRLTALGFDPRGTASFAATAAACLAVSASVYWLIERPSLRLRDRLLGRLGRA